MKTLIVILALGCMAASANAQSFVGLAYRFPPGGNSGSWGASIEFGRVYGGDFLLMGQFNFANITPKQSDFYGTTSSSQQVGLSLLALLRGKWINLGPQLGIVYGGGTTSNGYTVRRSQANLNYGGCLKIAFAAIPQSSLLSLDYGSQSGWGVGLTFPI